jgi:hypothetical protein
MKMFPKNCIGPSDVAVAVAHVDRSTPLAFDKAVLGWTGRNLDRNNAGQQNNTVPNHELREGIQNKLKVAHHASRGASDQSLRRPAPASYYGSGLEEQPMSKSQQSVNALHPFHAHSAWQGRPLPGLSCAGCAVDDPSSATASLRRVSSLNSTTSTGGPLFFSLPVPGADALVRLIIEVASCSFRSFFPAYVSGVVPVRRLVS